MQLGTLPREGGVPQAATSTKLLARLFSRTEPPPSLLVIIAHPDDEVIGAGAQLPRWRQAQFVHVTAGAPRNMTDAQAAGFTSSETYRAARRREVENALALAGISRSRIHRLGFVDQETSRNLPRLVESIFGVVKELRPAAILTHPYEGGHPDHDSTAFAVHIARQRLGSPDKAPAIFELTSYHNRAGKMHTGDFLYADRVVKTVWLSTEERALKRRLYRCFTTQERVLSFFPLKPERFRQRPATSSLTRHIRGSCITSCSTGA